MVTPDGCPVEAYAAIPAEPELTTVLALVGAACSILDLGAGTGRIADPLSRAGHTVVAVDESAEMLSHVRHATPVQSRIEDFDAGQRFDAVLLLSHLINTPSEVQRRNLLATVARHLEPDAVAILQRHHPQRRLQPGRAELGAVAVSLLDVDDTGWPVIRATTRYQLGDRVWDQPWEAVVLDGPATSTPCRRAGCARCGWTRSG